MGDRCLKCAQFLQASYPLHTWEQVCLNCASDPSFKKQFTESFEVWSGKKERSFFKSTVTSQSQKSYRLEQECDFVPVATFQSTHDMHPTDAGVSIESIDGKQGVVVMREKPATLVLCTEVRFGVEKSILPQDFRPGQASEVYDWYLSQNELKHLHTPASIKQKVENAKREKAVKEEQRRLGAALPGSNEGLGDHAGLGDEAGAAAGAAEDGDLDDEGEARVQLTPFDTEGKGKGSGKKKLNNNHKGASAHGSARAKTKNSKKKDAKQLSATQKQDDLASLGGKSTGAKSKGTWQTRDAAEKLDKYQAGLKVADLLAVTTEKAVGHIVWQAQTSLAAWQKTRPTASDTIVLGALVTNARKAVSLAPDMIHKHTRSARNTILEDLSRKVESWPPELQSSLLYMVVLETKLDSEEAGPTLQKVLFPLEYYDGTFDYENPTMATVVLSDVQRASLLQRIMSHILVALIQKGESFAKKAKKIIDLFITGLMEREGHMPPLLSAAVQDALCMCIGISTVLGAVTTDRSIRSLDALAAAQGGSKFLIQEAWPL